MLVYVRVHIDVTLDVGGAIRCENGVYMGEMKKVLEGNSPTHFGSLTTEIN